MKKHTPASFEPDEYMDSLLALREKDPVRYGTLPEEVRCVLAEYEREKEAARLKDQQAKVKNCGSKR
jgi:hypothetical protein